MRVGEPDNCICGRTISGSGVCPMHHNTDEVNIRSFMPVEQEAEFRVMYRNIYKKEGFSALFQVMGEMASCIKVLNDVIGEILEEKKKEKKDQ